MNCRSVYVVDGVSAAQSIENVFRIPSSAIVIFVGDVWISLKGPVLRGICLFTTQLPEAQPQAFDWCLVKIYVLSLGKPQRRILRFG